MARRRRSLNKAWTHEFKIYANGGSEGQTGLHRWAEWRYPRDLARQGRDRSEFRRSKIACYKERSRGSWKRCARRISWNARMDFGPDVIPTERCERCAGSSSRRRLDTYSRPTSAATLTTSSMNGCRRWWLIGLQTRSSYA